MNCRFSETVLHKMSKYRTYMFEAERYMWHHPQTGYKEWNAHSYLREKFFELGFDVIEAKDIPGFYFDIDTGKEGATVAILGELDALILPNHPECDRETSAVHACGHHCQSSALLGIAGVLSESDILSRLCGKIRIMAVPAEELIELEDRAQMKAEGKIRYISGKSEFMARGYFDSVDIALMLHSVDSDTPGLNILAGTSGIIAKRVVFHGSKNVGGAVPVNGINALYAAQTAMNAINALRETFPYNSNVRIHSIITKGGESVQLMPSEVVIESNIRAYDYDVLMNVNEKANRAYAASAAAFDAKVTIEDLEMYIPEDNKKVPSLVEIAHKVGCELYGYENSHLSIDGNYSHRSPGGTDMGNVGAVIPTIQPHLYSPEVRNHSVDFSVKNPEYAVLYHAAALTSMACELLKDNGEKAKKVIAEYTPIFSSVKEYCEEMDKLYKVKKAIEYREDNSALLQWV